MQYQSNISSIIDAVKIISPDSFLFANKTFTADVNIFYQPDGVKTTDPLVRSLTNVLYEQCYCRKFIGTYYESTPVTNDNRMFQAALSQANSTIEKWDKDWIIEQILPTGQYVAHKNGKYKLLYRASLLQQITGQYCQEKEPGLRYTA
jgi:hypothetical protein